MPIKESIARSLLRSGGACCVAPHAFIHTSSLSCAGRSVPVTTTTSATSDGGAVTAAAVVVVVEVVVVVVVLVSSDDGGASGELPIGG